MFIKPSVSAWEEKTMSQFIFCLFVGRRMKWSALTVLVLCEASVFLPFVYFCLIKNREEFRHLFARFLSSFMPFKCLEQMWNLLRPSEQLFMSLSEYGEKVTYFTLFFCLFPVSGNSSAGSHFRVVYFFYKTVTTALRATSLLKYKRVELVFVHAWAELLKELSWKKEESWALLQWLPCIHLVFVIIWCLNVVSPSDLCD